MENITPFKEGEIIDTLFGKARFNTQQEQTELDKHCYFCDFSYITPHQHHIIRKCDGGKNSESNILPLCANHHEMIHRRVAILIYSRGFYYLKNKLNGEIIPPTDRQKQKQRWLPMSSINNNKKLILKGDLKNKGVVIVKDFERSRRIKQKRILKEDKLKKEITLQNG